MNRDAIEKLAKIAESSGFKIYDLEKYIHTVQCQSLCGQTKFLKHDGNTIGFFGWLTRDSEDGLCVCVNNLFILMDYKDKFKIFDMCKFFKNKYPNIYKLEWHNQKNDEFKELILKGRKI